jgi:hypothetical protein
MANLIYFAQDVLRADVSQLWLLLRAAWQSWPMLPTLHCPCAECVGQGGPDL